MPIYLCIVYGCFCVTAAELNQTLYGQRNQKYVLSDPFSQKNYLSLSSKTTAECSISNGLGLRNSHSQKNKKPGP